MPASLDKLIGVFGAIVGVAMVTMLVSKQSDTANIIRSFGEAFGGSIRAATGR